jgi:hypothetical protein
MIQKFLKDETAATRAEMARTCLEVSRDMGNGSMVLVSRRVLAQLMADRPPRLGDVRAISMTLQTYFR